MAYPTFKSHEMVFDNVLNFKQLIKEAATKRIFNKDGSHFTNLSLIKPRPENVSTNLVVKSVQFIPKTTSVNEKNDGDIECLGVFPCMSESNQSLQKTTCLKNREGGIQFLIKNPHEVLLSEQKRIPVILHKIKGMQQQTDIGISMKSPVGLTIGDAENNRSTVTPVDNVSVKNLKEIATNFGANLKREVRYINLKKRSLELEKPLTSAQVIGTSKANSTVSTEAYTESETPSKIATGNIIKLPASCSDSNIQSLPKVASQNTTNNSPKPITRHFDSIKPKLNNTVVIENKTHSVKKIEISPQGEVMVHQNHEIEKEPPKKISAEKETQTDIYCWLFKNDNLYTAALDEANNCVTHKVVPVETALITSLFGETNNVREQTSADEKGPSKDLLKEDYLDFHRNITTKENSYPLSSTILAEDLTDCFQTPFIQDPTLDHHLNYTNNSFLNNTNKTYENIQNDKQLEIYRYNVKFPPSVTKLVNKICADIHSCQIQDAYGNMPLHQAVIDNHINRLKSQCIILKTIGSDLDHLNSDEETALMLAVKLAVDDRSRSYEAVSLLVQEGADQSVVDMEGYFPLHYAVKHGNVQLVNILLSARDAHKVIEKFGRDGFAPLHLAAIGDMHEIIHALMTSGANVNIKDRTSGRTSYFHAVEKGNEKAVAVLLAFKADTYEPNLAGQYPPVVKTNKLKQLTLSYPKSRKSTPVLEYLDKAEIPPNLSSIISPYKSSKEEILSEDGNPLSNQSNLEKVQNDKLLRADSFVPVNRLDGLGSIKSCSRINESNTHSSSLKRNLKTVSSKRLLSSKLLAQPQVVKLYKPNPIVSKELVNKQVEKESDLVIQKTAKGTRSVELRDRPTCTIKSILPAPSRTVEKQSAAEDRKHCPNILLSKKATLSQHNYSKKPSIVIKKDFSKTQAQKYTLANFFSRYDEISNSAENDANERIGKESKNSSNQKASHVLESNDNTTSNGSNNYVNKSTSSTPGSTLNLYGGDGIPTSVFEDIINNLESSNLEIESKSSKAELNSVTEDGLIQNVCVVSSDLERKKIKNTNNHCMVKDECESTEPIPETTKYATVEPTDNIEFCDVIVVNGKQIASLDLDSNIDALSAVIGDCGYSSKNTDIMCSNEDASYEIGMIESIESNISNNDISTGDDTFSNISKVNVDELQQRTSARKRSSSQIKPDAKNMSDEKSSSTQIKSKRIKKL